MQENHKVGSSKVCCEAGVFEHAIMRTLRNSTEFVYRVGLRDRRRDMKKKRGLRKKERKEMEARLAVDAIEAINSLPVSRRSGLDFCVKDFLGKNKGGFDHALLTTLERINHEFMATEKVLQTEFRVGGNRRGGKGGERRHRIDASFMVGVRLENSTDISRATAPRVNYENKKFTRAEISGVTIIPIKTQHGRRPLAKLALKHRAVTAFNTSLPLHIRDMTGFVLGNGMRGWRPKLHGPVSDGFRGTAELRFGGGEADGSTRVLLFSDFLAFGSTLRASKGKGGHRRKAPKKKYSNRRSKKREKNNKKKGKLQSRGSLDCIQDAAWEALQNFNEKATTKAGCGVGVRFDVKHARIKVDLAKLSSGNVKLHLGVGHDFSDKREIGDMDWNGM